MWSKLIACLMSVLALFSSLFGIGGNSPAHPYQAFTDQSYGADSRQTYDLFLPTDQGGTLGLVLYIHGGAWTSGDKSTYRATAENVAENYGYAAASINYRFLSKSVSMRDIFSDVNAAVAAIYDKAKAEGVTLSKMITAGISAGAHLALMYAYDTPADAKIRPVAVFSQCAPTDLADPNYYAEGMMLRNTYFSLVGSFLGQNGAQGLIAQYTAPYSPVTFVSAAVPTVIAHGQKDTVVPYSNAVTLDAALSENGVPHVFISYPDSGHALENDPDCASRFLQACVVYAAEYLN